MVHLSEEHCVACGGNAQAIELGQQQELLTQVPLWECYSKGQVSKLRRVFSFSSYTEGLEFTRLVADLAEHNNHHPAILLEWGRVTVSWWTHSIEGLHRNDFVMAAKTEKIYEARLS